MIRLNDYSNGPPEPGTIVTVKGKTYIAMDARAYAALGGDRCVLCALNNVLCAAFPCGFRVNSIFPYLYYITYKPQPTEEQQCK